MFCSDADLSRLQVHKMFISDTRGWLKYLCDCEVIDQTQKRDLLSLLGSSKPAVRTKALEFLYRIKTDHPELWISFCVKQRIFKEWQK